MLPTQVDLFPAAALSSHPGGVFHHVAGPAQTRAVVPACDESAHTRVTKVGRPRLYTSRAEQQRTYRERQKQRAVYPPLPTGPYRVLYADPPWQYRNSGMDNYGHAASHYPTLSMDALCALDVKGMTDKTAVLFLWVTMPLVFEVRPVITAWGFTYKTGLIWDKQQHNFGYYVGVRHELLLICTRGICRPDIQQLFPSVQRIPPQAHSRKPEEFRCLIDTLYPTGARLELFARQRANGWDSWGLEVPEDHEPPD
jgi:N6-adenosine-specific RNA methylase IME4